MPASYTPVRQMQPNGTITTRLLNTDGTEPPAGEPILSPKEYGETRLTDTQYKIDASMPVASRNKVHENFLWLSTNHPLLFEEILCFLEAIPEEQSKSVSLLLRHALTPSRTSPESYILTYYRLLIDTSPLVFTLADEGWYGYKAHRAQSLFVNARTACGHTVEHPYFTESLLAIWIMQEKHHPINNPFKSKDNENNLRLIHERFQEVYENRHELRARSTIDSAVVTELLKTYGPLRSGML